MERYDADPAVAKAIGIIDMATNPFWKQPVAVELEVAESTVPFKRMDSRTIVDPHTAGKQLILCSCPSGTRTINFAVSVQDSGPGWEDWWGQRMLLPGIFRCGIF